MRKAGLLWIPLASMFGRGVDSDVSAVVLSPRHWGSLRRTSQQPRKRRSRWSSTGLAASTSVANAAVKTPTAVPAFAKGRGPRRASGTRAAASPTTPEAAWRVRRAMTPRIPANPARAQRECALLQPATPDTASPRAGALPAPRMSSASPSVVRAPPVLPVMVSVLQRAAWFAWGSVPDSAPCREARRTA
jgi:hypothetical protein